MSRPCGRGRHLTALRSYGISPFAVEGSHPGRKKKTRRGWGTRASHPRKKQDGICRWLDYVVSHPSSKRRSMDGAPNVSSVKGRRRRCRAKKKFARSGSSVRRLRADCCKAHCSSKSRRRLPGAIPRFRRILQTRRPDRTRDVFPNHQCRSPSWRIASR